jgi:hypothetical protein
MGAEDFLVVVEGESSDFAKVRHILSAILGAQEVPETEGLVGETHFLYEDGQHKIEIEVSEEPSTGSIRLSCRFSLCHPESVIPVFGKLVKNIAGRMGLPVKIADEVPEGDSDSFFPPKFPRFDDILPRAIAMKRRYWVADFGAERASLTCSEAVRRFILGEDLQ